jgi:hypothetical protein
MDNEARARTAGLGRTTTRRTWTVRLRHFEGREMLRIFPDRGARYPGASDGNSRCHRRHKVRRRGWGCATIVRRRGLVRSVADDRGVPRVTQDHALLLPARPRMQRSRRRRAVRAGAPACGRPPRGGGRGRAGALGEPAAGLRAEQEQRRAAVPPPGIRTRPRRGTRRDRDARGGASPGCGEWAPRRLTARSRMATRRRVARSQVAHGANRTVTDAPPGHRLCTPGGPKVTAVSVRP